MESSGERAEWRDVWLGVAASVARRSSCSRSKVGAVLVVRNEDTYVGYNGPRPGLLNCDDGGCPRGLKRFVELPHAAPFDEAGSCNAVHAEINALLRFQNSHKDLHRDVLRLILKGAILYTTRKPCEMCEASIRRFSLDRAQVVWSD